MTAAARERLKTPVLLAYALPGFVFALPTIPITIHLPNLYGIHLGLGLATTGLVLFWARLFDTLTDPLVGALCDRFDFRGNRRKPWIAVGAIVAGFGVFKILHPPAGVGGTYLLVWSVVLYGGWTLVAVPYAAWGAELSDDYDERSRITAWREGFALLGIVGTGALVAAATALGWNEMESVGTIAWAAIIIGLVVVPLLLWSVPEPPTRARRQDKRSAALFLADLRRLAENRPFVRLLAAWFLNGLANGVPAALFFIYMEHGLGVGPDLRGAFVLLYFLSAIAAIGLWQRLSQKIGKHRAWCLAMLAACAAFLAVPMIPSGALAAFALVCVVTGMALGADLALPPSIQADVVDFNALRFGQPQAGLQFALWSMSSKLAMAAAVGIALPLLEAAGFDSTAPNEAGTWALTVIYAWVPVVIKVMAIAVVWGFPLTAERHALVRRGLARADLGRNKREQTNHDEAIDRGPLVTELS